MRNIFLIIFALCTFIVPTFAQETSDINTLNKYGYKKYKPYSKTLPNQVLDIKIVQNDDIKIVRKQLKGRGKVQHKANSFEYIIMNKTDNDIVIEKIVSKDIMNAFKSSTACLVPRGEDFIPGYRFFYMIQTRQEVFRFTKKPPVNETIKAKDYMRFLALTRKSVNPSVDFYFLIDGNEVVITSDINNFSQSTDEVEE